MDQRQQEPSQNQQVGNNQQHNQERQGEQQYQQQEHQQQKQQQQQQEQEQEQSHSNQQEHQQQQKQQLQQYQQEQNNAQKQQEMRQQGGKNKSMEAEQQQQERDQQQEIQQAEAQAQAEQGQIEEPNQKQIDDQGQQEHSQMVNEQQQNKQKKVIQEQTIRPNLNIDTHQHKKPQQNQKMQQQHPSTVVQPKQQHKKQTVIQHHQQKPAKQINPVLSAPKETPAPQPASSSHKHPEAEMSTPSAPVSQLSMISQPQKAKYINTLQNTLNTKNLQIKLLTTKNTSQSNQISLLQETNNGLRRKLEENEAKSTEIEGKFREKESILQGLQDQVIRMEGELTAYREVGDIRVLLMRVEELQHMVQVQKNQIHLLKQQPQLPRPDTSSQTTTPKQYLALLQTQTTETQSLHSQLHQLESQLQSKLKQNQQGLQIMNKMDRELKNNLETVNELRDEIARLNRDKLDLMAVYDSKIFKLQKYIQMHGGVARGVSRSLALSGSLDNVSNRSNDGSVQDKEVIDEQQLQQQNSKNQKIQSQKAQIFRQYLRLQIDHKNSQQSLRQLKNKYLQTCKQVRTMKKEMVTKKDYEEILAKYRKCKACLEKAIRVNRELRESMGNRDGMNEIAEQVVGNKVNTHVSRVLSANMLMSEQENNMQKYMQVYNSHVKQSINYFKNVNTILQNAQIEKLQSQISSHKQKIQQLQDKNQQLQKLNTIFQRQLIYKNSLMGSILEDSKNVRKQYQRVHDEKIKLQQQLAENVTAKSSLQRVYAKSANLLVRNRRILTQKENWRSLYEQLKSKYQAYIARDPYVEKQNQQKGIEPQKSKGDQMMQQGQIQQPQIARKVYQKPKPVATLSIQTQTQGLNQLYFKQIKQILLTLKRFPEVVKNATLNYQKIGKQLQQYRKRYDNTNLKFNLKFKELQDEKRQNEAWREGAKKQIIADFMDIRELIENQRLLNALRKAKNLIQYLEQEQEEEPGVSAQQANE